MCGLGLAGVQAHYNPDRVREPLLRTGNQGEAITWDKALGLINEKLNGVKGAEVAFLTGGMSGHVQALLGNFMDELGSKNHFSYEAISPAVLRVANKKAYGVSMPRYRIDKAKVVVSFGADFLGAWVSPVHFCETLFTLPQGNPSGRPRRAGADRAQNDTDGSECRPLDRSSSGFGRRAGTGHHQCAGQSRTQHSRRHRRSKQCLYAGAYQQRD